MYQSAKLKEPIKLKALAKVINAEIIGNAEVSIDSFCALSEPVRGALTFSKSVRYSAIKEVVEKAQVAAVIIPNNLKLEKDYSSDVSLLVVNDPLLSISKLSKQFLSHPLPEPGISKFADIHPSAQIGKEVHIGAFCSIAAGAVIGDRSVIFPHVVIYEGVSIGECCIIHSSAVIREFCQLGAFCIVQNGAVIGGEGFGYFLNEEKKLRAVPQVGTVNIADRVEIGANSCIDRATLGHTQISSDTKIDNLVQIGHNTKIGESSIICGSVGIAGSCKIGSGVTLGGCTGVADHVEIASGVRVGGKSGVIANIKDAGDYVGFPAVKASLWRRQTAALQKLPEVLSKLRSFTKEGK